MAFYCYMERDPNVSIMFDLFLFYNRLSPTLPFQTPPKKASANDPRLDKNACGPYGEVFSVSWAQWQLENSAFFRNKTRKDNTQVGTCKSNALSFSTYDE